MSYHFSTDTWDKKKRNEITTTERITITGQTKFKEKIQKEKSK